MDKLISIAIPFYNSEKYLRYSIQSVINQTYSNWELILIDDGGTDNSLTIAKEYEKSDRRIKVISDGCNKGLAVRLNESVGLSSGYYYARMDDDDIMSINRLEVQEKYLEEHKDVDVVGSSAMLIDSKNNIVGSHDMSTITTGFIHPSIMGKTEWFRQNPYAEWCRRCQDRELWLRTAAKSCFVNLKRPLLFYREAGTITFAKYLSSQKTNYEIFKHYKDYNKNLHWFLHSNIKNATTTVIYYILSKIGKIDSIVKHRKRNPLPEPLLLTKEMLTKSISK